MKSFKQILKERKKERRKKVVYVIHIILLFLKLSLAVIKTKYNLYIRCQNTKYAR